MAVQRKHTEESGAHEGKEKQHESPKNEEKQQNNQNEKP
jgi:hypothetical protein